MRFIIALRCTIILFCGAWVTLVPTPTFAERVLVHASSGQQGHGWLFGPMREGAGRCWIALPRHVVQDPFSETLKPFVFETVAGISGESADPIGVADVPGALEAARGIDDLAFAKVVAGPGPESCLSRLGLPGYAYDSVLRTAPEVAIFSLLPKSFGLFRAAVSRARSDAAGGGLVRLRALNRGDAETYFRQGLSGSVAEVAQPLGMQPFAMIIQVDEEPLAALAVRFDLIRNAFEIVEGADLRRVRAERAAAEGMPYRIDGFEGINRSDGIGPMSLKNPDLCWQVIPRGGAPAMRVQISVEDADDAIKGVSVIQAEGCGVAPLPVAVEQRSGPESSWSLAAECDTVAALGDVPGCLLDLRGPRQLRIAIWGRGMIGVNQIWLH